MLVMLIVMVMFQSMIPERKACAEVEEEGGAWINTYVEPEDSC